MINIDKIIAFMGLLSLLSIIFCLFMCYISGVVRQELLFEKTNKHVSWVTAMAYPEAYFGPEKIQIK